jgi:hypothetical protein
MISDSEINDVVDVRTALGARKSWDEIPNPGSDKKFPQR